MKKNNTPSPKHENDRHTVSNSKVEVEKAKVKVENAKAVGEWAKVAVVIVGLTGAIIKLVVDSCSEN